MRDAWLLESAPYAAANDCATFASSSLVYSHVVDQFFPTLHADGAGAAAAGGGGGGSGSRGGGGGVEDDPGGGAVAMCPTASRLFSRSGRLLLLVAYNLMWLPLLVIVDDEYVLGKMRAQRDAIRARGRTHVYWVAWILPSGRALLRSLSALAFAVVLTLRVPAAVGELGVLDVLIVLWTVAIVEAAGTEIGQRTWAVWRRDMFNQLELFLVRQG